MSHSEVLWNMLVQYNCDIGRLCDTKDASAHEAKIEALEYAIKLIEANNVPITE